MDTLWLTLRSDLRRKWRALVSLALLLGLAGGVVLTAAAGARRTDTAYPRLLNWANAAQLDVLPGAVVPPYFAALTRISQVTAMSSAIQYNLGLPASGGGFPDTQLEAFASPDDTFGVSVDRVKMLKGAMPDPGAANQVVIDPALAAMEHLRPGSMLRMTGIPYGPLSQGAEPDLALAFPLWFRVTGIALFDDQVVPTTATNEQPRVLLTPAFSQTGAAGSTVYLPTAGLRLRPGANPASVAAQARTLGRPYLAAQPIDTINLADEVAATQRAIRPQAVALAVFTGLAGLIALAVLCQLLARQLALDSAEFPILSAVGMTRGSLLSLAMARLAVVTVAGAAVAVAVAIAASPLMPIGSVQRRGCPFSACTMTSDQRPGDIRDYATVRDIPLVLAAVLALLAVGTLAHVLLTGVRRRRRDLAVLKTLGCTRSQVHGMVAWEASALAAAALLAGIPLGVIAGRWAWAVFADATGVASQATVDLPLVLLAIPVTLLLANVIAAWPGWTAARLRPATVLRTE
jgi:hypothetical protein